MKKEAKLRDWLKANKGDWHLSWIEPSYGSTVGFPDVIAITMSGKVIALELKWVAWKATNQPIMNLRPEQKNWHRMAAIRGVSSGFLVAVELPRSILKDNALSRRVAKDVSSGNRWWERHITNANCEWWVKRGWIPAVFSSKEMICAENGVPQMKAVYNSSELASCVSKW